jgi:cysteinyl-tRNA synthetase
MSRKLLGKEFDIHTGGIDLKFPHHENEIAQSTACEQSDIMARIFIHNDHVLVDGVKMSKSLGNFFTLRDIETRGFNPLAFRLLVLQGHYRNSVNFSWENLQAASNRMENWLRVAALRHQPVQNLSTGDESSLADSYGKELVEILANDLDTPRALAHIDASFESVVNYISPLEVKAITQYLQVIDNALGLNLLESTPDISDAQKELLSQRAKAREAKNWQESDDIRDELKRQGIEVRDDKYGQLWSYVYGVIDSPHFCL